MDLTLYRHDYYCALHTCKNFVVVSSHSCANKATQLSVRRRVLIVASSTLIPSLFLLPTPSSTSYSSFNIPTTSSRNSEMALRHHSFPAPVLNSSHLSTSQSKSTVLAGVQDAYWSDDDAVSAHSLSFKCMLIKFRTRVQEDNDCPLCAEEMDISDLNFKPCPCGYQVRFYRISWNITAYRASSCVVSAGTISNKISMEGVQLVVDHIPTKLYNSNQ